MRPAIIQGFPDRRQIEVLRQEMTEMFRDSIGGASLEEWERIAARYARATRDRAAGVLLGDISQDLSELSQLIRHQRAKSIARRLTRVSAQMSGLMCLVFCLLDDRRSFRKWARTASLAGNEAGDPETLSWVLAQEAYGHYYSGDVTEALDVAGHAGEVMHVPCTGAALAAALEARIRSHRQKHRNPKRPSTSRKHPLATRRRRPDSIRLRLQRSLIPLPRRKRLHSPARLQISHARSGPRARTMLPRKLRRLGNDPPRPSAMPHIRGRHCDRTGIR